MLDSHGVRSLDSPPQGKGPSDSGFGFVPAWELPEDEKLFMARHEVQVFLKGALGKLETGGRAADTTPLKKWLAGAPPAKGVR